jgi:hypothetical protein
MKSSLNAGFFFGDNQFLWSKSKFDPSSCSGKIKIAFINTDENQQVKTLFFVISSLAPEICSFSDCC